MKYLDRAFDTETTGLDPYHGSKPYFVTCCDEEDDQLYWEWDVDPVTREPIVPKSDLYEINRVYRYSKTRVFHNAVFDVTQLQTLGYKPWKTWDWDRVHDTYLAAHLLSSTQPKDLTSLTLIYCGINIQHLEDDVHDATNKARRLCRTYLSDWWITTAGHPMMPSVKGESWKSDMWLLKAIIKHKPMILPDEGEWKLGDDPNKHPWNDLLANYANADTAATISLYKILKKQIQEKGYEEVFLLRQKLLKIVHNMQKVGITLSQKRIDDLYYTYQDDSKQCENICKKISTVYNYHLTLPKSGNNKSLLSFIFDEDKLNFPVFEETATGNPSLNKSSVAKYIEHFKPNSIQYKFVHSLADKRKKDTQCNQMESYHNFWRPLEGDWKVLHPSLNPAGTSTLRWTSKNPSQQIISKQIDEYGTNIRYGFGPVTGREWWSLDYNNIELRIPAYESGEKDLVDLFERPDDPPFYGSVHLLNFSVVYKQLWNDHLKEVGPELIGETIKRLYKDEWYQWCKNGGFAIQYGAQKETADNSFRKKGSYDLLKKRFSKQDKLNNKYIKEANNSGKVSTLPDASLINPIGYPLSCSRSNWGKISPTIPLNYHVQGTACWVIMQAMITIDELLSSYPKHYMIMQVHDELVFDFPTANKIGTNTKLIKQIQGIMEDKGKNIGIPLTVGIEHHPNNWSESL